MDAPKNTMPILCASYYGRYLSDCDDIIVYIVYDILTDNRHPLNLIIGKVELLGFMWS